MTRNNHGFTLIEIVVVLVLISIIAAATFSRSITTDQVNFVGQVDKIHQHIRYAHSLALKRNEVWGILCTGNDYYWLFNGYKGADVATAIKLPGERNDKIVLEDIGVNMTANFFLFFDKYGKPYHMLDYDTPSNTQPVTAATPLKITISSRSDGSQTRELIITPETGFIITQ